jgi:hypothetical protein
MMNNLQYLIEFCCVILFYKNKRFLFVVVLVPFYLLFFILESWHGLNLTTEKLDVCETSIIFPSQITLRALDLRLKTTYGRFRWTKGPGWPVTPLVDAGALQNLSWLAHSILWKKVKSTVLWQITVLLAFF